MATPRVFISSTCYDLSEIRETIENYLDGLGYETVLSDKGHIYYQPGLHTHDSCIKEVSNCNLFILIIGGRYGGTYISDDNKSIVNAEYDAAKAEKIPIVTFIKRNVWDNHLFFIKNKKNDTNGIIEYPAIENQKNAIKIFSFIDKIRLSEKNNGVFPFNSANELVDILKKQFAGMVFNYLFEEKKESNQAIISGQLHVLENKLIKSNEMVEQLFKKLLNHDTAIDHINEIESNQHVNNFFFYLMQFFNTNKINNWHPLLKGETEMPNEWVEYTLQSSDFQIAEKDNDNLKYLVHINSFKSMPIVTESDMYRILSKHYNVFNTFSKDRLNEIISGLFNDK